MDPSHFDDVMLSDLEDGVISAFGHENPPAGLNPGPEADDTSDNEALPVPGDSTFDDVVLSGLEDGLISDAEHETPFGPNGGTPVGLNPVPEANTSGNDSLPVPVPNFSPLDEITEMNLFEDNDEPLLLPGLDTNDFGEFMEGFVVDDPTANSMPALGSAKKRVAEGRDATDESNPSQIPPKKRKQDSEEDRTCPHRSRVLCNKLSRDSHVKTVHGGNSTEKCPRCEALFQRKLQLGRHITKEHGKKTEVSCANCGARLMSNAALNAHNRQTHEPPQVASCSFCSGTFANDRQLKTHMLWAHPKEQPGTCHECDECGEVLAQKKGLRVHKERNHTIDAKYNCDVCGARWTSKRGRTEHINRMHPEQK